ncbi:hypothetical protein KL905_000084 [Ogataea polymorpha]|nr:hypothetical protein KL908_001197 [Ogataea polymorpha]KAG7902671.1 hypothetical protein KL935_001579 [Ogataea polymorpha]KAG7911341.1 hypothetical protein KL906_000662 [Ogataea polymorpha]KAG7912826.1 hypothetical protein KL907_001028 [Ogataea polymorpha]KAG7919441.1 hypothetical protein KL927_001570 [Ogataea polymorpha]
MLPNVPPKPLMEQVLDHDKLEYPLVPTSVTQKLKFPSELPEYFNELSTSKLQELARSPELLQSYLYKTSNFDQLGTEIVEALQKQIEYSTKLLKNVKEDIVPQTHQIDKQLEQFHEKLKKFGQLQVRMYDLLNRYSRESIIRAVERSVNEKDRETKSLVDQILLSEIRKIA